ncbi:uncharacterized protein EV420DRAFT_1573887 [Desarmillaria tabescens]|uniref:DUF6534 domain-containing protein n=1 Tax=Armillaria tabescens TaxID=1929756 RepID=A0AA39JNL3_ARMTA|nr:uncharacterized protein EV420DRAFT_1573887 [Desarmillaria tabescens]KAK0444609.1 hypothetical protein EV420DRAFT_1573887 [Desarmillaria tabescens]
MVDTLTFDRDEQLGSLLISLVVSAVMYGITTFQVYIFFKKDDNRPRDPMLMKGFVISLWILDTLQQAFVTQGVYWYLVNNFNNPSNIMESTWGHTAQIFITAIMNLSCQGFLIRRIWYLAPPKRKMIVAGVVCFISLVSLCAFIAMISVGVIFVQVNDMSQITRPGSRNSFYVTLGAGMGSDICIAICLCYQLSRSRPSIPRTKTVIDKLIRYAISTCLLTSLVATVSFIALATRPSSMVFIAIFCLLSKFYFNTLMATLNSRIELRRHLDGPTVVSLDLQYDNEIGIDLNTLSHPSGREGKRRHDNDLTSTCASGTETGLRVSYLYYPGL